MNRLESEFSEDTAREHDSRAVRVYITGGGEELRYPVKVLGPANDTGWVPVVSLYGSYPFKQPGYALARHLDNLDRPEYLEYIRERGTGMEQDLREIVAYLEIGTPVTIGVIGHAVGNRERASGRDWAQHRMHKLADRGQVKYESGHWSTRNPWGSGQEQEC
jgi:hypothetical protein